MFCGEPEQIDPVALDVVLIGSRDEPSIYVFYQVAVPRKDLPVSRVS